MLTDVHEIGLRQLGVELGDHDVEWRCADVSDFAAMQSVAQTAQERFGGIDVVVANAGTEAWAPVHSTDPEAFHRIINTNVLGVFNTVRAALGTLIDRRGYALVVASVSSYTPVPGMAAYAASKAAVEQFAAVLRVELAHRGVAVGSAHMSLVDTPMLRETQAASEEFSVLVSALPTPMRRPMTAEACAARFVNGIERRKRYIDVPRWVALARWFKPLLATRAATWPLARSFRHIDLDSGAAERPRTPGAR